jgi:uncharacterized protein YbjT (DUF2867 family)
MHIVIGAAAGNVGQRVTELIIQAGAEATLLVRNPAEVRPHLAAQARVIAVDMADAAAVVTATQRADALFWLIPPFVNAPDWQQWYHTVGAAGADALRKNRIPRAVLISSLGAGMTAGLSTVSYVGDVERRFNEAGASVVHLRPGYFMQNFLMQADTIRTQGFVSFPYAEDHDIPFVSAADIAATATHYLLNQDWAGQWSRNLMGQANLTLLQCAVLIGQAWGRPVRYRRQSYQELHQDLVRFGLPLNAQREMEALFRALGDPNGVYATPRTPDAVTPTSFQTFVRTELLPQLRLVDQDGPINH